MARFTEGAGATFDFDNDPDWKKLAFEYSQLLGVVVSKVGPQKIVEEDIDLYRRARLQIVMDYNTPGQLRLSLLGEDEYDEAVRTGRNPREDA